MQSKIKETGLIMTDHIGSSSKETRRKSMQHRQYAESAVIRLTSHSSFRIHSVPASITSYRLQRAGIRQISITFSLHTFVATGRSQTSWKWMKEIQKMKLKKSATIICRFRQIGRLTDSEQQINAGAQQYRGGRDPRYKPSGLPRLDWENISLKRHRSPTEGNREEIESVWVNTKA